MTEPDYADRAPGIGDPARSDDTATPGLRSGGAGRGASDGVAGPAPQGGDSSPDGEDVQVGTAPGPQTDWLRSAPGEGSSGPHEAPTETADLAGQPERALVVDDYGSQVHGEGSRTQADVGGVAPTGGAAADPRESRPDAEPGST